MILKIKKSRYQGTVKAPTSKSYTHRYILAAALSGENCYIRDVEMSDDIFATLSAIKALGVTYKLENNDIILLKNENIETNIDCNESGSTLRFIIPILLARGLSIKINAKPRLIERGIDIYEEIFPEAKIKKNYDNIILSGKITPKTYYLKANISSQYLTGLLFALPLLDGDSKIVLTTHLESKNYIDITLDVLAKAGIKIDKIDDGYYVFGNQKYQKIDEIVEADASNASFLASLSYLGNKEDKVYISNLNENSLQGDMVFQTFLKELDDGYQEIDIANCIDLAPVLFVFSSLKHGAHFTNTRRLSIKESNRSKAVAEELIKIGVDIIVYENDVYINKSNLKSPKDAFNSHNDHRLVMALSLISTLFDITINDAQAINKSYPSFFNTLQLLGAEYEVIEG